MAFISPQFDSMPTKSKSYCFTWNNYSAEWKQVLKNACGRTGVKLWAYQQEKGANGTPHIQGTVQFANQRGFSFQTVFPTALHWEVCQNWDASVVYCTEDDGTRDGETVSNVPGHPPVPAYDGFVVSESRWWQKLVLRIANGDREPRKVNWLWETTGNVGKSLLVRHMYIQKPGTVLLLAGKGSDVLHGVAAEVEKGREPTVVFWDLPRGTNVPDYSALESLKNGLFFSPKYESGCCLLKQIPHVFVFANIEPDLGRLSLDRWRVVEITEDEQEVL